MIRCGTCHSIDSQPIHETKERRLNLLQNEALLSFRHGHESADETDVLAERRLNQFKIDIGARDGHFGRIGE
jgi:hypothetical protein